MVIQLCTFIQGVIVYGFIHFSFKTNVVTKFVLEKQNKKIVECCIYSLKRHVYFTFLKNLKDLDPSYKTDLDLWGCFGRENPIL